MYTMLVLMLLLIRKGRKDKRGLFLAAYALIEVITNGVDSVTLWGGNEIYNLFPSIRFMAKPFTLLWVPLFYFYVRSCFSTEFKWNKKYLLHLLPFGLFFFFFLVLNRIKGTTLIAEKSFQFGSLENNSLYAIDFVIRFQYLFYNTLLILQLIHIERKIKLAQSQNNLNSSIKWLRLIVYGYAIACFGAILVFILFHFNWKLAGKINQFSILYFFIFFFVIFYVTITEKSITTKKNSKLSPETNITMNDILERLTILFEKDKIYLNPELSLTQLALLMNEKERAISQSINTLKQRNFKDFINSYRIMHACDLLKNNKDLAIYEVMFDSGFNTKGPFNNAFKKITGLTPSEYRNCIEENQ